MQSNKELLKQRDNHRDNEAICLHLGALAAGTTVAGSTVASYEFASHGMHMDPDMVSAIAFAAISSTFACD